MKGTIRLSAMMAVILLFFISPLSPVVEGAVVDEQDYTVRLAPELDQEGYGFEELSHTNTTLRDISGFEDDKIGLVKKPKFTPVMTIPEEQRSLPQDERSTMVAISDIYPHPWKDEVLFAKNTLGYDPEKGWEELSTGDVYSYNFTTGEVEDLNLIVNHAVKDLSVVKWNKTEYIIVSSGSGYTAYYDKGNGYGHINVPTDIKSGMPGTWENTISTLVTDPLDYNRIWAGSDHRGFYISNFYNNTLDKLLAVDDNLLHLSRDDIVDKVWRGMKIADGKEDFTWGSLQLWRDSILNIPDIGNDGVHIDEGSTNYMYRNGVSHYMKSNEKSFWVKLGVQVALVILTAGISQALSASSNAGALSAAMASPADEITVSVYSETGQYVDDIAFSSKEMAKLSTTDAAKIANAKQLTMSSEAAHISANQFKTTLLQEGISGHGGLATGVPIVTERVSTLIANGISQASSSWITTKTLAATYASLALSKMVVNKVLNTPTLEAEVSDPLSILVDKPVTDIEFTRPAKDVSGKDLSESEYLVVGPNYIGYSDFLPPKNLDDTQILDGWVRDQANAWDGIKDLFTDSGLLKLRRSELYGIPYQLIDDYEDGTLTKRFTHSLMADEAHEGENYLWQDVVQEDEDTWYVFGNSIEIIEKDETISIANVTPVYTKVNLFDGTSNGRYFYRNPSAIAPQKIDLLKKGNYDAGSYFLTDATKINRSNEESILLSLFSSQAFAEFNPSNGMILNDMGGVTAEFSEGTIEFDTTTACTFTAADGDKRVFIPTSSATSNNKRKALVGCDAGVFEYTEQRYHKQGVAEKLELTPDIDLNIGSVELSWTEVNDDGTSVQAQITVDDGENWITVTNGVQESTYDWYTSVGGTDNYTDKDLSKFRYRFILRDDDGMETPYVYNINYHLSKFQPPDFELVLNGDGPLWTSSELEFKLVYGNKTTVTSNEIASYDWDFGTENGSESFQDQANDEVIKNYRYSTPGVYTVTVSTTFAYSGDNYDLSDSVVVTIHNEKPWGSIQVRNSAGEWKPINPNTPLYYTDGNPYQLKADFTDSDGPDNKISYSWKGHRTNANGVEIAESGQIVDLEYKDLISAYDGITRYVELLVSDNFENEPGEKSFELDVLIDTLNSPPNVFRADLSSSTGTIVDNQLQYDNQVTISPNGADPDADGIIKVNMRWKDMGDGKYYYEQDKNGIKDFVVTPGPGMVGDYDIQMRMWDDSGEENSGSIWVSVGYITITASPQMGDWIVSEDIELVGKNFKRGIKLSGDLKISAGATLTLKNYRIQIQEQDGQVIVQPGAVLDMDNSELVGIKIGTGLGQSYTETANSSGLLKPQYWGFEIYGSLQAKDSKFKYLGHEISKFTANQLSGITFLTRIVNMVEQHGSGTLDNCIIDQSRFHGVTAASDETVTIKDSSIHDTVDQENEGGPNGYDSMAHIYADTNSHVVITGETNLDYIVSDDIVNNAIRAKSAILELDGTRISDVQDDAIYSSSAHIDIENSVIKDVVGDAISIHGGTWDIRDTYLEGSNTGDGMTGIYLTASSNRGNITGVTFRNFDTAFALNNPIDIDLIDCRFPEGVNKNDIAVHQNGKVTIKNHIKIQVLDKGAGYKGAHVAFRSGNSTVWSGYTDVNGYTDDVLITDRYYDGSSSPTRVNTSIVITTTATRLVDEIDAWLPGTRIYELSRDYEQPDSNGSTGGSIWDKEAEGFFSIGAAWWLVIGFVLLAGASMYAVFSNMGKSSAAAYSALSGIFVAGLLLFVINEWWVAVVLTSAAILVVVYLILDEVGIAGDLSKTVKGWW